MPKLNIDKLKTNPAALIVISAPGVLVNGYITSEISIDGSAEWNMALQNGAQENLGNVVNRAGAIFGQASGRPVSIPSPTPVEQSVASWTGTAKPLFTIQLVFVALRETDDVRNACYNLYKTVYPTADKIGLRTFLKPPLGYATSGLTAQGTADIRVGRWFYARGQIMKNVNFSYSKQTIANGTPLYASGSISFEPFRNITIGDLRGYMFSR